MDEKEVMKSKEMIEYTIDNLYQAIYRLKSVLRKMTEADEQKGL